MIHVLLFNKCAIVVAVLEVFSGKLLHVYIVFPRNMPKWFRDESFLCFQVGNRKAANTLVSGGVIIGSFSSNGIQEIPNGSTDEAGPLATPDNAGPFASGSNEEEVLEEELLDGKHFGVAVEQILIVLNWVTLARSYGP